MVAWHSVKRGTGHTAGSVLFTPTHRQYGEGSGFAHWSYRALRLGLKFRVPGSGLRAEGPEFRVLGLMV